MGVSPKWPVIQIADASGKVSLPPKWPVYQVADASGNLTTIGGSAPIDTALGLVGETISPYDATTHFAAGAGNLLLVLIQLPATTISTLGVWVTAGGVTGTGVNAMALYTEAGTLVDKTGDMTTALSSAGWASGALTGGAQSISSGAYYAGLLAHFTTDPQIAAQAATTTIPTINGHRPSIFVASQATVPASVNVGAASGNSGAYYFTVS